MYQKKASIKKAAALLLINHRDTACTSCFRWVHAAARCPTTLNTLHMMDPYMGLARRPHGGAKVTIDGGITSVLPAIY